MQICLKCGDEVTDAGSQRCESCGGPVVPVRDQESTLVGMTLDKYVLLEMLREGGMGAVYRAKQRDLDRIVAVKVLQLTTANRREALRRFYAEARNSSKLFHPNNARIFDFGHTKDGLLFIAMELVDGVPLSSLGLPLEPTRALLISHQICGALAEAHKFGLVHRDLKPDNIMISEVDGQDFVRVLDYGIAKLETSSAGLTEDGRIVGTPRYMSPEQISGDSIDARTDIYALGVTLYEMVTGQPPFDPEDPVALLYMHRHEAPPLPSTIVPFEKPLEDLILACLAKRKNDRPKSMAALRRQIERLLGERLHSFTPVPMRLDRAKLQQAITDLDAGAELAFWQSETVKTPLPQFPENWRGIETPTDTFRNVRVAEIASGAEEQALSASPASTPSALLSGVAGVSERSPSGPARVTERLSKRGVDQQLHEQTQFGDAVDAKEPAPAQRYSTSRWGQLGLGLALGAAAAVAVFWLAAEDAEPQLSAPDSKEAVAALPASVDLSPPELSPLEAAIAVTEVATVHATSSVRATTSARFLATRVHTDLRSRVDGQLAADVGAALGEAVARRAPTVAGPIGEAVAARLRASERRRWSRRESERSGEDDGAIEQGQSETQTEEDIRARILQRTRRPGTDTEDR